MRTLGQLLTEAAKSGSKKGGSSGVTIKISGGGAGAGAKSDKKKPASRSKSKDPLKLKDLLAHHEQAAVYHRTKSGEHNDFVAYHNAARDGLRHMGPVHAKIRDAHHTLADLYSKLGRDTYRASKVDPREAKAKDKTKAKSKGKARAKKAKKK